MQSAEATGGLYGLYPQNTYRYSSFGKKQERHRILMKKITAFPSSVGVWMAVLTLCLSLPTSASEQRVSIESTEYLIPGILSLPSLNAEPVAAVLLLHGTASQKNEVGDLYQRLASRLADTGVASLRIDFAGSGDSKADHSAYTLSGAVEDAQRSVDFLKNHPAINDKAIMVLGFSQGGLVAQRLALQEPRVLALATWSSVASDGIGSFRDFFGEHYAHALENGYAAVKFAWLPTPIAFTLAWFQEIEAQQTLSEMREFKRPILAIAGLADSTVPYEQSVQLVKQSTHALSQLVLLSGADHIFNVLAPDKHSQSASSHERLLDLTLEWIVRLTQAAAEESAP